MIIFNQGQNVLGVCVPNREPSPVLLAGAGYAQIKAGTSNFSFIMASNGDDLRDQMYIMYGIMLYNEDH